MHQLYNMLIFLFFLLYKSNACQQFILFAIYSGKMYTFCHHPIWYEDIFSLFSCLVFPKPDLSMSETKHQAQQNKTFLIAKDKLTVTESDIFFKWLLFLSKLKLNFPSKLFGLYFNNLFNTWIQRVFLTRNPLL